MPRAKLNNNYMEPENQSISKLRSITHFLQVSGRINLQNYNLPLFIEFLKNDPEISSIINNLLIKYDLVRSIVQKLVASNNHINTIRDQIKTFEEWVAVCLFYIEEVASGKLRGNPVIEKFITDNSRSPNWDKDDVAKTQFFNDCIEPIRIYIELQIKHSLNIFYIFQKYKILCEWYERDQIFNEKEKEITQHHLSKFLFEQGFTYSFSETKVPTGYIDNFAISIGVKDRKGLSTLPNAIIAEAKIFDGRIQDIRDVKVQISARIRDLLFKDGYCVIFNKTSDEIRLSGKGIEYTNGFFLFNGDNIRIYFIIINLHNDFYKSKKSPKITEVPF